MVQQVYSQKQQMTAQFIFMYVPLIILQNVSDLINNLFFI